MRHVRNQKGMALVMALVLAAVTLAFTAALLYMITQGTRMSGLEKRYTTALGAAKGGVEIATKIIDYDGNDPAALTANPSTSACVTSKLNNATASWAGCSGSSTSLDATQNPDFTLTLGTAPDVYAVSVKIVDTVAGNSPPVPGGSGGGASGGMVDTAGVVEGGASGGGVIRPMHVPFIYTVLVHSQRQNNPEEVADLTFVYAH